MGHTPEPNKIQEDDDDVFISFINELETAIAQTARQVQMNFPAAFFMDADQTNRDLEETIEIRIEKFERSQTDRQQLLVTCEKTAKQKLAQEPRGDKNNNTNSQLSSDHLSSPGDKLGFNQGKSDLGEPAPMSTHEELRLAKKELVAANKEIQTSQSKLHLVKEELWKVTAEYEKRTATASHEIRNSIGAMLNASHLLKAGRANQKLTDNAMSVIQQQSLHVSKLLDELFQVSPSPPKPKSHATPLKSVRHLRKTIKKVLVVEHQKDNREMLEALLKMEGFEVSTAQNANEALNLILHIMPDAALIDLGMGRDIGHRLAFNIRFQLAEKILLIAFTGRGESIETGAPSRPIFDEHLAKPIDLDQLLNILNPAPTSQSKPLSQVTSPISSQTR